MAKKHILIVAGEASGDAHAANLVSQIKELSSDITFSGLGGPKMKAAGVKLYADLVRMAVIGFIEILRHLEEFKRLFNLIVQKAKETKADAVILVDYPGFNLRLAKALKKLNIKVIYYISPQLWAWKENRIETIKNNIDKMIVVFPFEVDFYQKHGFTVDLVGHPLVDDVHVEKTPTEVLQGCGLKKNKITIGLLPGSRTGEVETLFPIMLQSAQSLYSKNPDVQFLVVTAPTIDREKLLKMTPRSLPIGFTKGNPYDGIHASDFCLVASGTATLETAILEKPMVVIYKTSFLTWLLAKCVVKIPYISLVNVVAKKKVVSECIQFEARASRISKELQKFLDDPKHVEATKDELRKVADSLGHGGASRRAAEVVLSFLNG